MNELDKNFASIDRLPPYIFEQINTLKMEARRNGEDIIDFSMGNPDGETPKFIVDKISTGSSNVFHCATPTAAQKPSDIDKVDVFIDGIRQRPDSLTGSNHDFVYSSADASVTITDPNLPSGLIVVIDALCPRP